MNRVEKLVDWALAEGLYVIINAHHETWLKKNYANADYRARFDAIWKQIAFRFKNKSPKLLCEILNEPTGMTKQDVDDLNPRILGVIREHNPTRLVVYSGNNYTSLHNLLTTKKLSDNYVIGNFHAYSPWEFAGLCKKSWGSKKDIHTLKWIYKRAHVWSTKHDIPVTINEFGVAKYNANRPENICSQKERISYLQTHVKFSKKYGIAVTVWDDGGIFSLYNRRKNTWTEDKDALVEANN
jgi:endoglucanase